MQSIEALRDTIAIDFDAVIHAHSRGWEDGSIYDVPIDGTRDALIALHDMGFKTLIYSTRLYERMVDKVNYLSQEKEMASWLVNHRIPYNGLWLGPGKPLCKFFIDDRAVTFISWSNTIREIRARINGAKPVQCFSQSDISEISPLSFATTDELIEEIKSRNRAFVIGWTKQDDPRGKEWAFGFNWSGTATEVQGLIARMKSQLDYIEWRKLDEAFEEADEEADEGNGDNEEKADGNSEEEITGD